MSQETIDNIVNAETIDNRFATFERLKTDLEDRNYHSAKLILLDIHYSDLADFIEMSPLDIQEKIALILAEDFNPLTLVELDPNVASSFINLIGHDLFIKILVQLDIEDIIAVLSNLQNDKIQEIVKSLPYEIRKNVTEGLQYPEDSAGRIMQKKFISIPVTWTVGEAINTIKRRKEAIDDFFSVILVDSKNKPVGTASLSQLLLTKRTEAVKELAEDDLKIASVDTDQSEVIYLFKQYGLNVIPIVNRTGKLVGVITLDNIIYLIDEEAEEDILHLAGVQEQDIYSRLLDTAKHRFPWLFVNLITSCITALVINMFDATISHMVVLAAIMPIVASVGGNAGTQTVTISVRALATKDLHLANSRKVIMKETLVSAINGLAIALSGGIIIYFLFHNLNLSLVFGLSVVINFVMAGFFGSAMPILLNSLKIDPAVSSSVFLTTFTDVIGFFTFLGLAYLFLIR